MPTQSTKAAQTRHLYTLSGVKDGWIIVRGEVRAVSELEAKQIFRKRWKVTGALIEGVSA